MLLPEKHHDVGAPMRSSMLMLMLMLMDGSSSRELAPACNGH